MQLILHGHLNMLYQMNQELISYGTQQIDTLTEIIDTAMKLNTRTTAVERKLPN